MIVDKEQIRARLGQRERISLSDPAYRRSAVLIPILAAEEHPSLLFTKRTDTVETHKGQISFPGGMKDERDASAEATALREAAEEIGLPPAAVDVLGLLDDIQTPTGFIITPVVGWISTTVDLRPNAREVAECFQVALEDFADTSRRTSRFVERGGRRFEVFWYDVWKEPVWGATGLCVKQLMDILTAE
jgi:8-oxo-dGTP pyrophosphatase MutT (NUDIX family)